MGNIVEIAFRVRVLKVCGGRNRAAMDAEDADDTLNTSCRAKQMSGH